MIKTKQTQEENSGVGLMMLLTIYSFPLPLDKNKVEANRENGKDPVAREINSITPDQL